MVLAENLLQTKLTLKAEKEYLQKITIIETLNVQR